ncbi:MAG: hypothetical protein LBC74_11485 [Planctomycetaceae bacterium]|nr:hypothetical protein [Planctomycetaceae bacterium]
MLTCRKPYLTPPKVENYSPHLEWLGVVSEVLKAIFYFRFFVVLMYF